MLNNKKLINYLGSPYEQIYFFSEKSQYGISSTIREEATQFIKDRLIDGDEESNKSDITLLELSQIPNESIEALLCLRCRVSKRIKNKLNILFNKHHEMHGLQLSEMAKLVLEDNGQLFLRIPEKNDNGAVIFERKPFNWSHLKILDEKSEIPFGTKIIYSFKSNLSNLSTWTETMVKSNSKLKDYFLKNHLILISPWALLADSSPTRVKEAWTRCSDRNNPLNLDMVELLHNSFISKYKKAKETYRKLKRKNSGWQPDLDFLQSLDPPQQNVNNLESIDESIRNYLTLKAKGYKSSDNIEEIEDESRFSEEPSIYSEASQIINQSLDRHAPSIMRAALDSDRQKWSKDPSRELAWKLYSEGLSQRDIAPKCGHQQPWVSRLFKENSFSEAIAQEVACDLVRYPEFKDVENDPSGKGIERMIEGLKTYILFPEREGELAPLRKWVGEALQK